MSVSRASTRTSRLPTTSRALSPNSGPLPPAAKTTDTDTDGRCPGGGGDAGWMRGAFGLGIRELGRSGRTPRSAAYWSRRGASSAAADTRRRPAPCRSDGAAQAGARARGATAYVTLDRATTGRTPPCAEAILAAGVARVVIADRFPDPRVNGAGSPAARSRDRGRVGCLAPRRRARRGFLTRDHDRPAVVRSSSPPRSTAASPRNRRKPLDHRPARAATSTGARPVRRGDGRHGHGARRRPTLKVRDLGIDDGAPFRIVAFTARPVAADRRASLEPSARQSSLWLCHDDVRGRRATRRLAGSRWELF